MDINEITENQEAKGLEREFLLANRNRQCSQRQISVKTTAVHEISRCHFAIEMIGGCDLNLIFLEYFQYK